MMNIHDEEAYYMNDQEKLSQEVFESYFFYHGDEHLPDSVSKITGINPVNLEELPKESESRTFFDKEIQFNTPIEDMREPL